MTVETGGVCVRLQRTPVHDGAGGRWWHLLARPRGSVDWSSPAVLSYCSGEDVSDVPSAGHGSLSSLCQYEFSLVNGVRQVAPLCTQPNTCFLGPTGVHDPNGISVGSASPAHVVQW